MMIKKPALPMGKTGLDNLTYTSGGWVAFDGEKIPSKFHGHSIHVVGAVDLLGLGDLLGVNTLELDNLHHFVTTVEFNDLTLGLELTWVL